MTLLDPANVRSRTRYARLLPGLLAVLLLTVGAAAGAKTLRVDASGGESLRIDLQAGGKIHITGNAGREVVVDVTGRDSDSENFEIELRRRGDGVVLSSEYVGSSRRWSSDLQFEISVPHRFDINLSTTGGNLVIDDVDGTFEGSTMGGSIELTQLTGVARLETMGGNILVSDSELDGKVSTMGGKVTLRDLVGDLEGTSMGGNVSLLRVTRRNGSGSGETVNITTMGGAVDVDEAPAGARLSTMGGNVSVASAREFVDAKTMGGNIKIDELEGWVKAVTMGGNIEVRVVGEGGDGADVFLESMGGDVELIVPAGFGMELDIELAFTKRHEGKHDIRTRMPIQRSVSPNWIRDRGDARKIITGTGTVGDGRHKVKIRTINGDVVLKEG